MDVIVKMKKIPVKNKKGGSRDLIKKMKKRGVP